MTMEKNDLNNDELDRQITNNIEPKDSIRLKGCYLKDKNG